MRSGDEPARIARAAWYPVRDTTPTRRRCSGIAVGLSVTVGLCFVGLCFVGLCFVSPGRAFSPVLFDHLHALKSRNDRGSFAKNAGVRIDGFEPFVCCKGSGGLLVSDPKLEFAKKLGNISQM